MNGTTDVSTESMFPVLFHIMPWTCVCVEEGFPVCCQVSQYQVYIDYLKSEKLTR